ncbi:hypothetical protein ACLBYG_21860 [Methylobacterium sp. D53M]
MSQHLALGLLIPFAGRLGVKLISLWLDIRRAVAAALPDSDALAAGKAGEDENGRAA